MNYFGEQPNIGSNQPMNGWWKITLFCVENEPPLHLTVYSSFFSTPGARREEEKTTKTNLAKAINISINSSSRLGCRAVELLQPRLPDFNDELNTLALFLDKSKKLTTLVVIIKDFTTEFKPD